MVLLVRATATHIHSSVDEKGPVRAVWLVVSCRERVSDEGRAAPEEKHDEA